MTSTGQNVLFREMSPAEALVHRPDPSNVPDALSTGFRYPPRSREWNPVGNFSLLFGPSSGTETRVSCTSWAPVGALRQPPVHNEFEAGDRNDVPLQAAVLLTCLPQVPSSPLCPRDARTRLLETLQWPLLIALPLEQQATVAAVDPVHVCKAMNQAT
jgi:hypothetical protein